MGFEDEEEDKISYEEKMKILSDNFKKISRKSSDLDKEIENFLKKLGF